MHSSQKVPEPFTIAFGGHLAIAGIARLKCDYPQLRDGRIIALSIAIAWLIEFALYIVAVGASAAAILAAAIGLIGIAAVALIFWFIQPGLDDCPTDTPRWIRQALAGTVGSLVGLVPLAHWGSS